MRRSTFVIAMVAGFLCAVSVQCLEGAAAEGAGSKRVQARPFFTGKVVQVNGLLETFSVRGREATVTFDASRPVLRGYRSLSDMRVGDLVAVSYLEDGISVMRQGSGRPERPAGGAPWVRTAHGMLKRTQRGSTATFDDVDVNKDGRISPVELSTIIPDITLDKFRQHDANSDGYLDRAEFAAALKAQRATKAG